MGDLSWAVLSQDLLKAMVETALMMGIGLLSALLLGLPLGFLIYLTRRGMLLENRLLNLLGGLVVNFARSLPFVILLILVIPFSRLVTGRTTGPLAASVPLAIASIAFYARLVEGALSEVKPGVLEAARALGAGHWLTVREVLFPEALPGLVRGFTMTAVSLIGYTAMAGVLELRQGSAIATRPTSARTTPRQGTCATICNKKGCCGSSIAASTKTANKTPPATPRSKKSSIAKT